MARKLGSRFNSFPGKTRLAGDAFARALKVIHRTLMANDGVDHLLFLSRLRQRQTSTRNSWAGSNSLTPRFEDVSRGRVWDSLPVKRHALRLAADFAREMIGVDERFGSRQTVPSARGTY